jgi:uncharacterized RDD family membrane protein YckC
VTATVPGRVHQESALETSEPSYEGLVTRCIAFGIDGAVIDLVAIVVTGVAALALSVLSGPDWLEPAVIAVGGLVFLAWTIGYFVTFWSTTGQTPGDRVMQIRVRRADGGPLSIGRSFLRLVYLTLAALPLFLGFVPILFDDRRRGIHDMLAGTVVVAAPRMS